MKKANILWGIGAILVLLFLVSVAMGWHTYTTTLNSAPFWIWVMVDGVCYLVPAVLLWAVGLLIRRKENMKK